MKYAPLPFSYPPAPLTPDSIRESVPAGVPGAYVLYWRNQDKVEPIYVGRSDTDLQRRLLRHPHRWLDAFAFLSCGSAWAAYRAERRAYFWLRPALNQLFPAQPPDGSIGNASIFWPIPRFSAPE